MKLYNNKFINLLLLPFTIATNIGTVLQITDHHLDLYYKEGAPTNCFLGSTGMGCCRKLNIPIKPYNKAGKYGDFNCDIPTVLLQDTFNWIGQNLVKPDFILWTGDSAGHHIITQTPSENMKTIEVTTDLFIQYFPNITVYPCLGNHDTYPVDQLPKKPLNKYITNSISKQWSKLLNTDTPNIVNYGYYTTLVKPGFRIISLNSLYFLSNNYLCPNCGVEQLNWLESTLHYAVLHKEKVWIIGHVLPNGGGITKFFSYHFQQIFSRYNQIILSNFWGHTHYDQYFLIRNNNTINATVTGVGYVPAALIPDKHNPSFRIYDYDRTTMEILNYHQYSLDLKSVNNGSKFKYNYQYNPIDSYNMSNMSYTEWERITQIFKTSRTMFDKYYYNYNSQYPNECDSQCWKDKICDIEYVYSDVNTLCVG